MCCRGLAQMVERPLRMREVPLSIPGLSKDMAETFLWLTATSMFCFLLFLIVFLPVLFPLFVYCYCHLHGWRVLSSCTKSLTAVLGRFLAVLQSLCYLLVLGDRFLVDSFTLCLRQPKKATTMTSLFIRNHLKPNDQGTVQTITNQLVR